MSLPNQGHLVLISGPAGSGKSTLAEIVLQREAGKVRRAVTATTRAPRPGEVDGVDYYFLTYDQFIEDLRANRFVEYKHFNGNFYGCPTDSLSQALQRPGITLLVIEVDGAESIRFFYPNASYIYIISPSPASLRERLSGRGTESEEQIEGRLTIAKQEMKRLAEYDFLIVNSDLETAVTDLQNTLMVISRSIIVGGEAEAWENGAYEDWK